LDGAGLLVRPYWQRLCSHTMHDRKQIRKKHQQVPI
jgi:hypothetical protein